MKISRNIISILIALCLLLCASACNDSEAQNKVNQGERLLPVKTDFHHNPKESDFDYTIHAAFDWTEKGCVVTTQDVVLEKEYHNGQTIEQTGIMMLIYDYDDELNTLNLSFRYKLQDSEDAETSYTITYWLNEKSSVTKIQINGLGNREIISRITNIENNTISYSFENIQPEPITGSATIAMDSHTIESDLFGHKVIYRYNDDGYLWEHTNNVKSEYDNNGNILSLKSDEEFGILSVTYSDVALSQPWQHLVELLTFNHLGYISLCDDGEDLMLLTPLFSSFINAQ
ncbi:MAG: hypothetical protein IKZ47_06625 [Clostridia bacterium]|nr:hypothetical protein [Clostridia bacterium]